jgi:glucosamine-6-phosphate deaminase
VATRVHIFRSADALALALASKIADGIASAGAAERPFILGCPSGRSPHPTYQALAVEVARRALPLRHVVLAMMDNYIERRPDGTLGHVDPRAHYSCQRFGHDEILAPLNAGSPAPIPPEGVWFADPADPGAFDGRLRAAGGIDLFLLASGASDGHVAFNPPGSLRDSRTRIIELAESTRRDNLGTFPEFGGLAEVPQFGLSVGIATIAEAKAQAMIVTGRHKRHAFARVSSASAYDPTWPATIIAECPGGAIYADAEAAHEDPATSPREEPRHG